MVSKIFKKYDGELPRAISNQKMNDYIKELCKIVDLVSSINIMKIEPLISHLKHDYRMIRNYLKGTVGDAVNVMLAASVMNFKRMINIWREQFIFFALKFFTFSPSTLICFFNTKLKITLRIE